MNIPEKILAMAEWLCQNWQSMPNGLYPKEGFSIEMMDWITEGSRYERIKTPARVSITSCEMQFSKEILLQIKATDEFVYFLVILSWLLYKGCDELEADLRSFDVCIANGRVMNKMVLPFLEMLSLSPPIGMNANRSQAFFNYYNI